MVAMHTAWLLSIVAWVIFKNPEPNVPLLVLYAVLQIFRVWVMVSLGPYWTTRIITVPGVPLVRRGPYRFLRHPNYVVVVLEIVVLPVVVGAVAIAVIFSVANAAMLFVRIRAEEKALQAREIS
jgi:methyltransferase